METENVRRARVCVWTSDVLLGPFQHVGEVAELCNIFESEIILSKWHLFIIALHTYIHT